MKTHNRTPYSDPPSGVGKPWHIWLFGSLMLLLYAVAVYDFIMIHSNNTDYLMSLNAQGEVITYFKNYPLPLSLLWGVNIFGVPVAVFLSFYGSRWARSFAWWSAIAMLGLFVPTFGFMNRWSIFGAKQGIMDILALLITTGYFFYCTALVKRGVLR